MRFLVVRVAILAATLTVWTTEFGGKAHRIRIIVPHKITYVHHHHPKPSLHSHGSGEDDGQEEDDSGSSEEHQGYRGVSPRYAVPEFKRSNRAAVLWYKDFFRRRIKVPRRHFRYEDDVRRWPEEEDDFDVDGF